jgi:hypothetical protein
VIVIYVTNVQHNYSRSSTEFRDVLVTSVLLSVKPDRAGCIRAPGMRCQGEQLPVRNNEKFLGILFLRLKAVAIPFVRTAWLRLEPLRCICRLLKKRENRASYGPWRGSWVRPIPVGTKVNPSASSPCGANRPDAACLTRQSSSPRRSFARIVPAASRIGYHSFMN